MRTEQQPSWGVGSMTMFLVVAICLVYLPLGMGPGPLGPPPFSLLIAFVVVLAAIFVFLSQAAN